jgi:hypothetical protein
MIGRSMCRQLRPAHARHAHVQQDAAFLLRLAGIQECLGAGMALAPDQRGFQQNRQAGADAGVVVDDVDDGCRHGLTSRWAG